MKLKSGLTACGLALCLMTQPLTAGQFEDGLAAHDRADYATTLRLWKPLAEQGHVVAQYWLGVMYAEGEGVPQDDPRQSNGIAKPLGWADTPLHNCISDACTTWVGAYREITRSR